MTFSWLVPIAWAAFAAAPEPSFDAKDMLSIIKTLSSDAFEGRAPGTPGEEKSIALIAGRFKALGLKPAAGGSYFQDVSLRGATLVEDSFRFEIEAPAGRKSFNLGDDAMFGSHFDKPRIAVDAPVVFAGYGVEAPEHRWDDFKGMDVKGKVLVVLINDPPVKGLFAGPAMTYYGRWTYKFEECARRGAAACLIVHETEPAAYPWEVVKNSFGGEQFFLSRDRSKSLPAAGWISRETAVRLFQAAGTSFEAAKKDALSKDFRPVDLGLKARISFRLERRTVASRNVAARLEGSDPEGRGEWLVVMAHWDHLGVKDAPGGRLVFHGAQDNASGVAGLLALAGAFARRPPPRRSILFLAVTAEEKNLLGSEHYARRPLAPLKKTVAAFNMDVLNVHGRTRDVQVVGWGQSDLDDILVRHAKAQGRVVKPDEEPEKGLYYRSDHFSLAKRGVPSLYLKGGMDFVGRPEGWGKRLRKEYTEKRYHKPADEVRRDWDLSGTVQDLILLYSALSELADSSFWPRWSHSSEFRALRPSPQGR